MAVNTIYRESWLKSNGWNVRVDFIAAGGSPAKHGDRTVTAINGVFKDVSGHKASFADGIPFGLADAESCKFVVDYTAAPAGMQSALVGQFATVADGEFASLTNDKYRLPRYMPQAITSVKPKQPNLFMVWSDRGTSNGIASTVVFGGQVGTLTDGTYTNAATTSYLPGPMDTITGTGLTVTYTVSGGVVTTASIGTSKGTGFKVGDQVYVGNLTTTFAYFTVTAIEAPTWYIEFMGCQRISPSTKYTVTPQRMEIEIEAIGIHKICLESITDLTTYTRSYIGTQADSSVGGNYYHGAKSTSDIVDFDYVYSRIRYKMYSTSTLVHWHAPLGSLFGYMQEAFDEAFEFFSMEGFQGLLDNSTNLSGTYPATTSNIKLMRQAMFSDYLTNVELGQTNGTLHDTAAELTEIRFIFAVTKDNRGDYDNPDSWAGGLFTDFAEGIRKDCDSAWDLLRKLAEQFFLKVSPYYEFSSGLMKAKWNVTEPYATSYGVPTLNYDDTRGDASFETNAETRESVKQHYFVTGNDADSVEVTSYTKSGKKIECNHIFDVRVRTAPDGTDFDFRVGTENADKFITIPYARLRGLYVIRGGIIGFPVAALTAVSPRITLSFINTGTSQFTAVSENVYARTSDTRDPNYVLHDPTFPLRTADVFMIRIRELQELAVNGFGYAALVLAYYFGVPADPTDPNSVSQFESNNQTMYDMELPLASTRLAERIGHRTDITPASALSSSISPKGYLVELETDWTARDAGSDYVKAKYLTRNIKFN